MKRNVFRRVRAVSENELRKKFERDAVLDNAIVGYLNHLERPVFSGFKVLDMEKTTKESGAVFKRRFAVPVKVRTVERVLLYALLVETIVVALKGWAW